MTDDVRDGAVASIVARTDAGNARRLVDWHAYTIRRVSDMGAWFRWDGQRWEKDHDAAYIRYRARLLAEELPEDDADAKKFKRNSLSAVGLSSAVRIAEADPLVTIRATDLDSHAHLLNTRSGIVDLRSGTIHAHKPEYLLSRICPTNVEMDGPHPRWDAFLAETFDSDAEMIGFVQRMFGLALIGDVREHVLPFLHGVGSNGKGVLLLVAQALLGNADNGGYAVSAPDGFLMSGRDNVHPTEIARLRGARLVVCSEQTGGKRFDEAKVKRLTGGDLLTGRFMRGDFFDFDPSHLILVASNHLPEVREGGPSFWRRVRLVPFEHVVPPEKRDGELDRKLVDSEGPAILAWMIRGAMRVYADGLAAPEKVLAATDDYRVSEDALASFIRDECFLGDHYHTRVPEFRVRFEHHCRELGVEPPSQKAVALRLASEWKIRSGRTKRDRLYHGVGLVSTEEDDPRGDG